MSTKVVWDAIGEALICVIEPVIPQGSVCCGCNEEQYSHWPKCQSLHSVFLRKGGSVMCEAGFSLAFY